MGRAHAMRRPGRAVRAGWAIALVGAVCAAGCGPDAVTPSGRSMADTAADAQAVATAAPNRAPVVRSVRLEPRHPIAGEKVTATVEAFDPDGDPVRVQYRWAFGGVETPERSPTVSLANTTRGTEVSLTAIATDGRSDSEPRVIRTRLANRPPAVARVELEPADGVPAGDIVSAIVRVTDGDDEDVRVRYAWEVNGHTTAATDDQFSTRGLRRGDAIRVRVVANDGHDDSEPVWSAPVQVANLAPQITSRPGGLSEDGVFRYTVAARDPDGDRTLRYRLEAGPSGMTIDPLAGRLEWTPSEAHRGTHEVIVAVSDALGAEGQQRFELTVAGAEPESAAPPAAPAR